MTATDRTGLETLVPHRGAMCLLDRVVACDANAIECRATSHRDAAHPLRVDGRLPALAAIEYAAQAMAAHGGSRSRVADAPVRPGRLAAVRDVRLHAATLDDAAELVVRAECVAAGAALLVYAFAVSAGERVLAEGRATVMLAAPDAAPA